MTISTKINTSYFITSAVDLIKTFLEHLLDKFQQKTVLNQNYVV